MVYLPSMPVLLSRYVSPAPQFGLKLTNQPDSKTAVSTLKTLSAHYSYLAAASQGPSSKKNKKSGGTTAGSEDVGGEWQSVMEAEFYDFVLFEIPKVDF
jgi:V-type H+-transporting ATPase subunit C